MMTSNFSSHRHALLIPALFIVIIEGFNQSRNKYPIKTAILWYLIPVIAVMLLWPGSVISQRLKEMYIKPEYRNDYHFRYTRHDKLTDSIIANIPSKVAVASNEWTRSKLTNREWSFIHPYPTDSMRADYYVFDFLEAIDMVDNRPVRQRFNNLVTSGNFLIQSNVDGIVVLVKDADNHFAVPYYIKQIDVLIANGDSIAGYSNFSSRIIPVQSGFEMSCRFLKLSRNTNVDAAISFFVDSKNDTIRVVHLPIYTMVDFCILPAGMYEEQFFFQIPVGKSLDKRIHTICLYEKDRHLPLMVRKREDRWCYSVSELEDIARP
jgi:hypothetical protein